MMRILVLGANGQVGFDLVQRIQAQPRISLTALDRRQLELTDMHAVRAALRSAPPDVLINAAAFTAVDRAETERDAASALNSILPQVLAEECRKLGAWLVHYSTDYVFDGSKPTPYIEDDVKRPVNWYGMTKHQGDLAVEGSGAEHLILRVSWVYSSRGRNFLLTVLRLAAEGKPLRIVDDQIGAPTPSSLIAGVTCQLLQEKMRLNGVFHLAPAGSTSWAGFAAEILKRSTSPATVVPITTADYPTAAKRPANSVLSCDKLRRITGIALDPWQRYLDGVMEKDVCHRG
jgi:dTDP-4-dehydrorhamnose reductase